MILKETIQKDLIEAMKSKDELTSSVLRMLRAAILNKEKEKHYKLGQEKPKEEIEKESQLIDEEIIEVISTEVKKRREAIAGYEKGGRTEAAKKEEKEMIILQKYLPEQLSEEEIKKLVKEAIKKTGAQDIKDMGKIMGQLAPKFKGKADGGMVSKIVKELLVLKTK